MATASTSNQDLSPRLSHGTYEPYREGAAAVTYDESQVPAGARAKVLSTPLGNGQTRITVVLGGLEPDREYGAHVHTKPCGATGKDAGPHFQQDVDPVRPSVDPAYANPENEVWLDFRTNSAGHAVSHATGDWQFRGRMANSFVIHEEHTSTAPGEAGSAGSRLACLNAQF
ncbi:hypothetical protein GCM10027563_30520 [Parasphingorhabdus pacifica]